MKINKNHNRKVLKYDNLTYINKKGMKKMSPFILGIFSYNNIIKYSNLNKDITLTPYIKEENLQ